MSWFLFFPPLATHQPCLNIFSLQGQPQLQSGGLPGHIALDASLIVWPHVRHWLGQSLDSTTDGSSKDPPHLHHYRKMKSRMTEQGKRLKPEPSLISLQMDAAAAFSAAQWEFLQEAPQRGVGLGRAISSSTSTDSLHVLSIICLSRLLMLICAW
ncbi:hypothetical protein CRENBAI_025027 [Crenichthys baileyi]|uniref:Uncharacterized protein n=1 Tax=Crenichthys baileyi TaxID=28760 RepID=A0AAV9RAD2_9TELE